MKTFLRDNGLSVTLVGLFILFWTGQALTGFADHNRDEQIHGRSQIGFGDYLTSDHFWEATFENWESEFLQMAAYVVLTVFLYQRGSAESKDPDKPEPRTARRRKTLRRILYEHSLSLALLTFFSMAWIGHGLAGRAHFNSELQEHGLATITFAQYLGSSRFWFESFQNWQSEFVAVAAIVILSIWLREAGSPESKPVDAPDSNTGN
jgi:hypothetical protein